MSKILAFVTRVIYARQLNLVAAATHVHAPVTLNLRTCIDITATLLRFSKNQEGTHGLESGLRYGLGLE